MEMEEAEQDARGLVDDEEAREGRIEKDFSAGTVYECRL